MNNLGVGIVATPHFMSWSNKNFTISSGVWTRGRITMGDYNWLKMRRITE
jgi:hypothetical protein